MTKAAEIPKGKGKKVSFVLTDQEFADLALYTSSCAEARPPGPYMKRRALEYVAEGTKLREKLNGHAPATKVDTKKR